MSYIPDNEPRLPGTAKLLLPMSQNGISGAASARATIDGEEYINFFGSGYLALSGRPELRAAALNAVQCGMAFSRQIPSALGASEPVFDDVESLSATAIGAGSSVYFASGYLIGIVGLASIARSFDVILIDEFAHFCLRDASKITGLAVHTFAHCDPESLKAELVRNVRAAQRPLVVTDGAFATTGRIPPLRDYATIIEPFDGRFFIDESHSFGVVGTEGRGSAEYCGVECLVASSGATLSKAFCAQGAFVACSEREAVRLRDVGPIRGACAGSPISAAVAAASLRYASLHPELRQAVTSLTQYFRRRLRGAGLEVIDSPAPIVSFRCGTKRDMQALMVRLRTRGILIYHSTYIGSGREGMIRCAVFRDHSEADIDVLVDAI